MSEFLKKTREVLYSKIKNLEPPKTLQVLNGRKFLAVLLEGYLGVGYAPRIDYPSCSTIESLVELYKMPALKLADLALSENPTERGIGISALNALSQFIIKSKPELYNRYSNLDIIDALPINKSSKVGMIGFIHPFISFLTQHSACLKIVDDNPMLNSGRQKEGYILSRDIEDLKDSDIVLITGSTLIEHSIEEPLKIVKNAKYKVIVGPTASWLPDVAFEYGIDAVSGMTFHDPEKAFRTIMEGGGTMEFVKYAEKYTLTKEKRM